MTQVLPAALVAPTRAGQSVGYQIRAVDGTTIATAFTTTGVAEVTSTGCYRVNGGITAPDDGGTLEWYLNNAGSPGTFLSAVAIEPAPNQADQAAGIRAALGLASANVDTQLSTISSKTTNLPAAPAAVGDIPTTTQIWTHATRALTDKDSFNLASSQTFSTTGSVGSVTGAVTVGIINNNVITANAIATDAFDADAIAASAVTELQANLATQASVDALPNAPAIADAVWDETLGTRANGTTGKKLADTSTLTTGDIPAGLTAQQNTRLTQLWQQAGFDSAVPVVRDKEGDVITETIGTTVITHTATNDGDTVITERQP
jgi:hypothetical protein